MASHLTLDLEARAGELWLVHRGEVDDEEGIEALRVALEAAHARAIAGAVKTVVLDWQDLAFATSLSIKVFAGWIIDVLETEPFAIRIRATPKHPWQQRTCAAFVGIAGDVLSVETLIG